MIRFFGETNRLLNALPRLKITNLQSIEAVRKGLENQ